MKILIVTLIALGSMSAFGVEVCNLNAQHDGLFYEAECTNTADSFDISKKLVVQAAVKTLLNKGYEIKASINNIHGIILVKNSI